MKETQEPEAAEDPPHLEDNRTCRHAMNPGFPGPGGSALSGRAGVIRLPHPDDVAARAALAAREPAPLERVERQARASRRHREPYQRPGSGGGAPSQNQSSEPL